MEGRLPCLLAVLVVMSASVMPGVQGDCPAGWTQRNSSCYFASSSRYTWVNAVAYCSLYKASPVVFNTEAEWDYVMDLVMYGVRTNYWMGLTYNFGSKHWTWLDSSPYNKTATHWVSNREGAPKNKVQTCTMFPSYVKYTYLQSCTGQNSVLCERPATAYDLCDEEGGWTDILGQCLKLFDDPKSWFDANDTCESYGGSLFAPHNVTEFYVMGDMRICRSKDSSFWIGISDTNSPRQLRLVDNSPLKYAPWAPYGNRIIQAGQTCVQSVSMGNFNFATDECSEEKRFLCTRPHGTCPQGWRAHGGSCYLLQGGDKRDAWADASQACQNIGTQLVIINSADELAFIGSVLNSARVGGVWIGLSDFKQDNVQQWVDGTPLTYSNFDRGWPHNSTGRPDCTYARRGRSRPSWYTDYCYRIREYMCEMPITQMNVTVATQPPAGYGCDKGWKMFRKDCYFIGHGKRFDDARAFCQSNNADLTSVRDPLEQSFLVRLLGRSGYSFIGLLRDRTRNGFYWVSDASLPNFTNWRPGEPNDSNRKEDCALMNNAANGMPGSWNDDNCNRTSDFFCRKPAGWIMSSGSTTPHAITAPDIRRCGLGWIFNPDDDFCYQINADSPQTWDFARADCKFKGGDLASITGPKQQIHLQATITASRYGQALYSFWIGATDKSQKGGWSWTDGSPFRYLNWHPGEPSSASKGEDCVEIVGAWQYMWNDEHCDSKNPYICKKPAQLTSTAVTPVPTPVVTKESCQGEPLISGTYSLPDSGLTASSKFDSQHVAANSRIYSGSHGCWRSSTNSGKEWIGASFYNILVIKGLTTTGCPTANMWVTKYKLQYQFNFYSPWYWYEDPPGTTKVFVGNTDARSQVTNKLMFPIEAKALRLVPVEWQNGVGLRWEILGCVEEDCYPDYGLSGPLVVEDGGWTASTVSDVLHPANMARLRPFSATVRPSCWRPDPSESAPYIQVDLGSVKVLRGVTTMGNPDADEWVTSYTLQFRLNSGSSSFHFYTEPYGQTKTFTGNSNNNSTVTQYLKSHVQAQQVRLLPITKYGAFALRFDLLVCPLGCREIPLISGPTPVTDRQLSSSTSLNSEHGPQRARLNQAHQGDFAGGWNPEVSDSFQYIQVDLGTTIQVQAVATQGREDKNQYIRTYTLSYSNDGKQWYPYFEGHNIRQFDANWDNSTPRKHYLSIPMMARYVRLWPRTWQDRIGLRWELYGCPGPMSGQAIGCYADAPGQRDLPYESLSDPAAGLWPPMCIHHCYLKGYYYAGLQNGNECYCGNSYGRYGPGQNCSVHCFPRQLFLCGGKTSNFVYTTGLTSQNKICMEGWTGYGDICFRLIESKLTWAEARSTCQQVGAELASVGSQHEQDFVFSLLTTAVDDVWMGFNDRQQEMFFEWSNDDVVRYTNWNTGQPNAAPNTDEDCVAINAKTGGWQDDDCSVQHPFLCKASKQSTDMPTLKPTVQGCEQGWEAFRWSCYLYVTQPQRWQDALQVCQSLSGSLVRIDDRFEQAYLSSSLGQHSGYYWTDVSDTRRPGVYQYADGRTFVPLTNWAKDKPDKNGSCVSVGSKDQAGLWFNQDCSTKAGFVCERQRVGFTTPTPAPVTQPQFGCPQGWVDGYSYCYQVNAVNQTHWLPWSLARQDCVSQGAELASFHNASVLDSIWRNYLVGSNNNFWIGLTNLNSQSGYAWTDGSPLQFTNWAANEPNNQRGRENCGEIVAALGKFNDQACSSTRNWICSIKRGITPTPRSTMMVPSAGPAGSCAPLNDTWSLYNGNCYTVGRNALSWRDARIACRSNLAELASISDMLENNFVDNLLHASGQRQAWLGFDELDWDYGFRWSDGSPTKFVYWNQGEPNDYMGSESCVSMYAHSGKWNDNHCSKKFAYVCKRNMGKPVSPSATPPQLTGFCPAGFKMFGTKCYKLMANWNSGQQLANWTDARKACTNLGQGFDLASITNAREQALVTTLLADSGYQAWVGLQRVGGSWRWVDNEDLTFSAWKTGEPNGNGGNKETCGMLMGTTRYAGLWYDTKCAETAMYICQTRIKPTIPTPESVPNSCGVGYQGLSHSCFKFVSTPLNYTLASSFCVSQGATLPSINNQFEQSFLYLLVTDPANFSPFWIGMTDLQHTGQYGWQDTWPVLYTNWGTMEPSKNAGEGCVSMDQDGTWDDDVCSKEFAFVCKKSTAAPPYTPAPSDGLCQGSGWMPFGKKCYTFKADTYVQFSTAIFDCQESGGTLVTVHDQATNDFIQANIAMDISGMVWLGLYGSQTRGYAWRDNSPVQFTNWDANEPSGVDAQGQEQHCAELRSWNGKWNDLACSNWRGYICERPMVYDKTHVTFPSIPNQQGVATPPQPSWPQQTTPTRNPATNAPVTNPPRTNPPLTQPHPQSFGPILHPTQSPMVTYPTQRPVVTYPTQRPVVTYPTQRPPFTLRPTQWPYYTPRPQQQSQSGSQMSGGSVAGIVIAAVVVVAAALGVGLFLWRRKRPSFARDEGFSNAVYDATTQGVQVDADPSSSA